MPAEAKGPRLWFKPGAIGAAGKRLPGTWIIKDGERRISTGVRSPRRGKPPQEAQDALARHILERREIPRTKHRSADAVQVADVLAIYMADKAEKQARPRNVIARCEMLLTFWGERRLSEVTGKTCREYAAWRGKPVARRELEDLRAAIIYHRREGLCREVVDVVLPEAGLPRDRWLNRNEVARLLWAAWRFRSRRDNQASRKHAARFILVALYTGTRAGAVCAASLGHVSAGSGWIDLERGIFYRRGSAQRETRKRQPPAELPIRLLAHLRRWHKNGQRYAVEWHGRPVSTGVDRAFRMSCLEAGLEAVMPHTLRHTAATWLVASGVSFEKAADFLGMEVGTLIKTYRHHAPNFQREAADAITRKPKQSAMRSTISAAKN